MKKHIATLSLLACCHCASAQSGGTGAEQPMDLHMKDIVIAGLGNNAGQGAGVPIVNMPMTGVSAFTSGIESQEIEVTLMSTSDFDVVVSSSSTYFSYSGPSTSNPQMLVKDVLDIMFTSNGTLGTIVNGHAQYQPVMPGGGNMAINLGKKGIRTFKFKYKATPGFTYPGGTYTTDIVFTVVKQ